MALASTPRLPPGSGFLFCAAILVGCGASGPSATAGEELDDAPAVSDVLRPVPTAQARPLAEPQPPPARPETTLGVSDTGIFGDLDDQVQLGLPPDADPGSVTAILDSKRKLLVAYVGDRPVKVYPLAGDDSLSVGSISLALRPGDAAELRPLLSAGDVTELSGDDPAPPGDADRDGIPDPLDLLIGAHKTALNAAAYGAGYIQIGYPNGDVPREVGVCTDVVVRAVRNVGVDLQSELQDDIKRSRRSYPMVKKRNSHIDHRRVKTLLPYFLRHWSRRSAELDDETDPLLPGDVVFMDTFPSRSGPDHIGIVSDRIADSGRPLVINNWTDGTRTEEMDLLGFVPVTHRFRYSSE